MERFTRTGRRILCPFKGVAAHYSVGEGDQASENAACAYECPNPAFREIAGCLAFYPGKADVEAEPA